jgi:hypothetical protein
VAIIRQSCKTELILMSLKIYADVVGLLCCEQSRKKEEDHNIDVDTFSVCLKGFFFFFF